MPARCGGFVDDHFDPYYTWFGIPADEQPADHYRLLGVRKFEQNEDVISNAADQRMTYLRTFQTGKRANESQRLLNEVATAQACLLNRAKRTAYDAQLRQQEVAARAKTTLKAPPLPMARPLAPTVASHTRPLGPPQPIPAPPPAYAPPAPPHPVLPSPVPPTSALATTPTPASRIPPSRIAALSAAYGLSPALLVAGVSSIAILVMIAAGLGYVGWRRQQVAAVPAATSIQETSADNASLPTVMPAPPVVEPVGSPPGEAAPLASIDPTELNPSETPPRDTTPSSTGEPSAKPPSEPMPSPAATAEAPLPVPMPPEEDLPTTLPDDVVPPGALVGIVPCGPGPQTVRFLGRGQRYLIFGPEAGGPGTMFDLTTGTECWTGIISTSVSVSFDGKLVAAIVWNTDVLQRIVEVRELSGASIGKEPVRRVVVWPQTPLTAAISRDAQLLYVGCSGKPGIRTFGIRTVRPAEQIASKLEDVAWLATTPDNDRLYARSSQNRVESIPTRGSSPSYVHNGAWPGSISLHYSGDAANPHLLVFLRRAVDRVGASRDTAKGLTGAHDVPGEARGLGMSPDGNLLALATDDELLLRRPTDEKFRLDIRQPPDWLEFAGISSPSGRIALAGPNDSIAIWDLKSLFLRPAWRMPSREQWLAHDYRAPWDKEPADPAAAPMPAKVAPPLRLLDPREAIAALKAKGFSLSDNPDEVHSLAIPASQTIDEEDGRQIASLPNLQHLSLLQHQQPGPFLRGLRGSRVQTLVLSNSWVADADLEFVAELSALEHLYLADTRLTPACLTHLQRLPMLKTLYCPNHWSREAIAGLCRLSKLESITPFPQGMTEADFAQLCQLPNLKRLVLIGFPLDWSALRHLRGLRQLEAIEFPPNVPPESLVHIAHLNLNSFNFPEKSGDAELEHLARMTNLQLVTAPPEMTDKGMAILGGLPRLSVLNLQRATQVTDAGMGALANLQSLNGIMTPPGITNLGLRPLAKLEQLNWVDLTTGTQLTSAGLDALVDTPNLVSVAMGPHFDDSAADRLVRMKRLTNVQFDRTPITSRGLAKLASVESIQQLSLVDVPLGASEVDELCKFKQLTNLVILNAKLSSEQKETLQKAIPKCNLHCP